MHALAARASSRLACAASTTSSPLARSGRRPGATHLFNTTTNKTRAMASAPGDAPGPVGPSPFSGPGSEELRALCVGPCSR